jgi:hypothetical protein
VSTAEWDAVDPLGGILNSDWEERQAEARAEAARPLVHRTLKRFMTWLKADPPNMSDGDIRLDVDPDEPKVPLEESLNKQQLRVFRESADPSQDMTVVPTDFYDGLLRPKDPADQTRPASD